MWDHMNGYGGWMGIGWFTMLLFWILVIIVIVAAIRWLSDRPHSEGRAGRRRKRALDILEERYARGEIDREEYLGKKADLEGD